MRRHGVKVISAKDDPAIVKILAILNNVLLPIAFEKKNMKIYTPIAPIVTTL